MLAIDVMVNLYDVGCRCDGSLYDVGYSCYDELVKCWL